MEKRLGVEGENDGCMDDLKPSVQWSQSSAIWFFWDTYEAFALSSGMEQSYIDSFVRYYTSAGWLAAIILFTVICGFLGSMIGGKLIQKHFKKAGVL